MIYIDYIDQWGPSWSYGRCIYNYLCNQGLSPLTLCEFEYRSCGVYSIKHLFCMW